MFSNVWSENTALFERLMEIHSNSPKLYYGFNGAIITYIFAIMMGFLQEHCKIQAFLEKAAIGHIFANFCSIQ